MSDLISRQAAITAIQNAYCDTEGGEDKCAVWKNVGLTNALHIMQDLPSAQPERKRGKWEIYVISMLDGEGCRCSECGLEGVPYWDFCPNCGADMRGESDDIPNEYFESGGK